MAQLEMEKNYESVMQIIREHGKPNPSYPSDLDLDYGTLSKLSGFGGLAVILKNMKKKKMVDFGDQGFFKDDSIITLIGDYDTPATSQQITYDQINTRVKGEETSHQKTAGW